MNEQLMRKLRAFQQRKREGAADELSRILVEEGLSNPGEFACFLTEWMKYSRKGEAVKHDSGALERVGRQKDAGLKIRHRPPEECFYYRGKAIEPKDIRRFDDQPLHFVVVGDDTADTRLMAFDSYAEVREILRHKFALDDLASPNHDRRPPIIVQAVDGDGRPAISSVEIQWTPRTPSEPPDGGGSGGGFVPCPKSAERPSGEAQFCQDRDYGGHWFWLAPGWQIGRLTNKDLSHAIFSGSDSWNDRISSIKGGDGLLVAFEHIDFQGSTFSFCGRGEPEPIYSINPHPFCGRELLGWKYRGYAQNYPALSPFGWNDRISSVQHFPFSS